MFLIQRAQNAELVLAVYCREGAVVFREGDKTVYFFVILCFLSLSFGERDSVDLEAY